MSLAPHPVPRGLCWYKPPAAQDRYELRDGEDQVRGTVLFRPKSGIAWAYTDRRHARGEIGSSRWDLSIERKGVSGFFGLSGTAYIDGGATGIVKAGPFFASGALSLASGRRMRWQGSVFERTRCTFADESGRILVQINPGSFSKRVIGSVDVEPPAAGMSEWPLLVILALYLRLLMNRIWD